MGMLSPAGAMSGGVGGEGACGASLAVRTWVVAVVGGALKLIQRS